MTDLGDLRSLPLYLPQVRPGKHLRRQIPGLRKERRSVGEKEQGFPAVADTPPPPSGWLAPDTKTLGL